MKKIALSLFAAALFAAPTISHARLGTNIYKAGLGPVLPLVGDLKDVADLGFSLQGQILHYVKGDLAVGGELNLVFFGDEDRGNVEYETESFILQGIARKDFQSGSRKTPFALVGLGLAHTEVDASVGGPVLGIGSASDDDTSPSLVFGGGVDIPLQSGATLGFSARYQHLFFDIGSVDGGGFLHLLAQMRW